jgi:hypothetical protein
MFLNYIKNFFLKYTLKNKWREVSSPAITTVRSIGLLLDETVFSQNGFAANSIRILVYRDTINTKETYSEYTFNGNSLNWDGTIKDEVINEFIQTEFDLLISYYEIEKAILLLITNNSKAKFKVGFSSIDKRLHHLMISTAIENHTVFVNELCKYLKILNKIES